MLFLFLEAKEAVEVIEAGDVIMSVEVIEATEVYTIEKELQKSRERRRKDKNSS